MENEDLVQTLSSQAEASSGHQETEDAIEAVCRELCKVDGYDPDMQFFRVELCRLSLPGGQAFALPERTSSVWTAYYGYAEAVLRLASAPYVDAGKEIA